MTVKEVYETLNEDYGEVFDRIGNDRFINKYLKKFITEDYNMGLVKAYDVKDWDEIYRMVHTMKGLALNLGLARLASITTAMCSVIKGKTDRLAQEDVDEFNNMYEEYKKEYSQIESVLILLD